LLLEQVTSKAKEIAVGKLVGGTDADVIEIGNADGFKIYATVGKTLHV
jgi:hypothetical protein